MKIVEANFVGLEDEIWTKVAIKLDDGREGFLLFENEGRDVEVESESFDHSELFKGGVFDDMEILEGPIADGCRAYEEHFTRLEEIEAADAEAVAKLRLEAQPLETQRMPMLLNVVEQYQDYSDPDGFPNIFVLSDGTLVLCSEKRSVHIKQDREIVQTSYKTGLDFKVQSALDHNDVEAKNFGPVQRLLYNLILGG